MGDISLVVNVALAEEGEALASENMNVVALFTSDTNVLSSAERYRQYQTAAAVAADFGSESAVTQFANAVFATSPNPVSANGSFNVAYWRAVDETVAASAATLRGEQVTESATLPNLQVISDGSFDIDVDGTTQNITGLDFQTSTSMEDVADVLDTAITGATVTYDDLSILITSDTTGATSLLSYASEGASGTYAGALLAIDSGSGSVLTQGADSSVLSAESKVAAMTALNEELAYKGSVFIDDLTDAEVEAVAEYVQANDMMHYNVFSDESNLEVDATNPVWKLKLAGQNQFRALYSKAGNRKLAASYMARMHTVNFDGTNTAITMNLKELSVAAEEYTDTELAKCQTVGLDVYTLFGGQNNFVEKLYTSGANGWTDNVYNLLSYVNSLQTDIFNLLGTTTTKIPQTQRGLNQITGQMEKTTRGYVTAGVFAPGTWTSTDFFGDVDTFNDNIETKGFYIYANSLAAQNSEDRQSRITPLIQVAVKNAGAFHEVNVLINFNQ